MLRSRLGRVVAALLPCLTASFASAPTARAEGTLIPATTRTDMAHDVARQRIYISSGSQLLRYDLNTKTFLSPIQVGGSLTGMDISPDGNTLAVANRYSADAPGTTLNIQIDLVNLESGVVTPARFPRAMGEGGAYGVAFEATGKLVVSSGESGFVRLIDLTTNTSTTFPNSSLYSAGMVTASGNRSVVGFTENGLSDGKWGRYSVADGSFVKRSGYTDGTSWSNYEIGVSSSGDQFGLPTYGGTFFYNSSYQKIKQLGAYSNDHGTGIAYHPTRNLIFLPWRSTSQIRVFNSTTFKQVGAYNFESTFDTFAGNSFGVGRTKVSADGSLLMCNVPGGVRYVSLADIDSPDRPLSASGENIELDEDSSVAFTLASTGGSPTASPSYIISTFPVNGALTGTPPNLTYTPRANYEGGDNLTFQVTRGGVTSSARVFFSIRSIKDAPVVIPKTVTTRRDTKVTIVGQATDADYSSANSPQFSWRVSTPPSHGTAALSTPTFSTTNTFIYTPEPGFLGTDTFQVIANDETFAMGLDSLPATITVIVAANSAPVTVADSYTRSATTSFTVPSPGLLANDIDADGDALTCITDSYPSVSYGSIAVRTDGSFTWTTSYTPGSAPPAQISFSYRASDAIGPGNYETATIQLTRPTTATAQSVTVTEDTPKAITLAGTGDGTLTYVVVSNPTKGKLSGTAPNLTYTPNPNYYGSDYFTFSVSSGGQTSTAGVSINVSGVADLPVAYNQNLNTVTNTPVSTVLRATDGDDNGFAWFIVAQPTNGTLSGTAPNVTYTPRTGFTGDDFFTFKVNEGAYDSNIARVSIKVSIPSGTAPVAASNTYRVNRSSSLTVAAPGVLANDSDSDGDALRAVLTAPPRYASSFALNDDGSFNWTGFSFSWQGDYASDSFTYRVSDGTQLSAPATVIIQINDAPSVEQVQNYFFAEDTTRSFTLSAWDRQANEILTYELLSQPTNGSLSGTAPNLIYSPRPNFNGVDSFTWRASDGMAQSNVSTIRFTVSPVNDAPSATPQSLTLDEDTSKEIVLTGSDVEGSNLNFVIIRQPSKGTLSGTAPNLTYTPNSNYSGTDLFTFKSNDGSLDSSPVLVDLLVIPVPDAPVASNQTVALEEDTPRAFTLASSDADGSTLTYEVINAPTSGALSGTAPNLTYTPNANFNGTDSFTYKANDGISDSEVATVSMVVAPVNDAPSATNAALSVLDGESQTLTLAGSDVDGDPLTFAIATGPTKGKLSGTAPEITYTANVNVEGPDSFTFTVSDGTLTATGTVSVTITWDNKAPTANAQSIETKEDTPKTFALSGTDPDGNGAGLTFAIASAPQRGTLSGSVSNLTYTPNRDYHGADSFTFTVYDGNLTSEPATVSITVTSVNDVPSAISQNFKIQEDTEKAITLSGRDLDEDALTFTVLSQPTKGTLSGTSPNLAYTPNSNATGADSFTFTSTDGELTSRVATVSIFIEAVNDAPTAAAQHVDTDEDTAKVIVLSGTDPDGDALTFATATPPQNGTLSGDAPNLTYTPKLNYSGTDSFTFTVSDGSLSSEPATVTIGLASANDAPVANPQTVSVAEDIEKAILLTGSDVDNDTLTFTVTVEPTHGTLNGTAPNLTYVPNANTNGSDNFKFKVNDGALDSTEATVTINVTAVSDAPVAWADAYKAVEDQTLTVAAPGVLDNDRDADGDTLTALLSTNAAHGSVTLNSNGGFTYTPDANYSGNDSFKYRARDGAIDSAVVTVSLYVAPVNDAPVASGQSVETDEETAKTVVLGGTDAEGDALTFMVVTRPAHGTLSGDAPNLTYTPAANSNGTDSFTFKVNDGALDSETATINILVKPINDAPVASEQSVSTLEDTAKEIVLGGSDADGGNLRFSVVTGPTRGTLSGTAPNLTYTPAANASGTDSFTFKANDGTVDSAPATVSITVTAVNDTPSAKDSALTTAEDTAKSFTLSASDVEGETLTYSVVTGPTKGALSGTAPNLTYTPAANATGTDSLVWRASDGNSSVTATVSITITPVNDAPTADAQSVSTAFNTAKAIVLSGNDVEGSSLTYTIVTGPTRGTLSGTGANRTYTPNLAYSGPDSFTFRSSDGSLSSATATVSITIAPAVVIPKVEVTYTITNQTATTFSANVQIRNNGPATKGWTLVWQFAGNQRITSMSRGAFTQSGQSVTVNNIGSNKTINTGATETISFQATYSGTNAKPTAFTFNGVPTAVK